MIEKIGRVARASVLKGSGKDWDQWMKILLAAGAEKWTHQKIVAHLESSRPKKKVMSGL